VRLIVYNPKGGAAIWGSRLRRAIAELQSQPEPSTLVATEARDMIGPVRRALAANPGVTEIVACGGDGTVAACVAALGGRDIPIGIIPTGTSNVLAFELGLPTHAVEAARLLRAARRRIPFRTWRVNEQTMILQLGVGFDGMLMWRTPRAVKRALGFIGVSLSALRHSVAFDFAPVRVSGTLASGAQRSVVATSVLVANCRRWAGPRILIPDADPADDVIDVLLLQYQNIRQLTAFWLAILLPGAPHLRLPFVEHARMRGLRIEHVGRPVEAHVDGEPTLMTPLDVAPLGVVHLLGPANVSSGA
jgi:diacylglycerol kinase family enzyme